MVLYMLLFVSALNGEKEGTASRSGSKQGGRGGEAGFAQPLLRGEGGDTSSHASLDQQDYSPMRYDPMSGRGKSFTEIVENIANRLSISVHAEEFQDGNDEMTPLRTMSVA